MDFKGQRFVVTGGAGFIGSHIVDELLNRGAAVVVVDDLSTGAKANLASVLDNVEFIEASILDAGTLQKAIRGSAGIFHLAAVASVVASIEDPVRTHEVNATGTLQVLEAARLCTEPPKVVFSSSAATYGNDETVPKVELMQPSPTTPYGTQKFLGELYLGNYHKLHGLAGVSLRYFNVFGPRQDPGSMYSGVVSAFADRVARGRGVTINGDGQSTRDFVYVADVVQANLRAMGSDVKDGRPINVGTGCATSILDLAKIIHQVSGREGNISHGPERSGDIRHSCADIDLARTLIKFEPKWDLISGLRRLLAG